MKVKIERQHRDFLLNAKKVKSQQGETYYYFPVFKETNEIDVFEQISFKDLPQGLKNYFKNS
jgi:hypothetical protein